MGPWQHLLPHIQNIKTYEGVDPTEALAQRAGIPPEKVIRLNGNENPYGASPRVAQALGNYQHFNHYPDPEQRNLRTELAEYLDTDPERIVAGNGSDEIIDLVLRMFVGHGQKVIDPSPTFGMYSFCTNICGGQVVDVPRDAAFELNVDDIKLNLDGQTRMIFLASPNNPTGNVAQQWQVRHLLDMGIIVVVDETYHEFCGHTVLPMVYKYPNLIVLRSFSKWAGLAGLRIGLGVMHPIIARAMMKIKPPYNVSLAAEIALLSSLKDRQGLTDRVTLIVNERERMLSMLAGLQLVKPLPSQANFILCQLPDGRGRHVYEGLARRGIFVRHFDHPRLLDYVRISVGLPHETEALTVCMKDVLDE